MLTNVFFSSRGFPAKIFTLFNIPQFDDLVNVSEAVDVFSHFIKNVQVWLIGHGFDPFDQLVGVQAQVPVTRGYQSEQHCAIY